MASLYHLDAYCRSFEPDFLVFKDAEVSTELASLHPMDIEEDGAAQPVIPIHIIDAKSSGHLRMSHQVQVGYYAIALKALLSQCGLHRNFCIAGNAAVWRPVQSVMDAQIITSTRLCPVVTAVEETFDVEIVEPLVANFIASQLPELLCVPDSQADWHVNQNCLGCEYEVECKERLVREGRLGLISNLSQGQRKWLKDCISTSHTEATDGSRTPKAGGVVEIEELASLLHRVTAGEPFPPRAVLASKTAQKQLTNLLKASPTGESPVLTAARTAATMSNSSFSSAPSSIAVVPSGSFTTAAPSTEDVSIYVEFAINYLTNEPAHWFLRVIDRRAAPTAAGKPTANIGGDYFGSAAEFESYACSCLLVKLAEILQSQGPILQNWQLYVADNTQCNVLQKLICNCVMLDESLHVEEESAARICVKSFLDASNALLSSDQPAGVGIAIPTTKAPINERATAAVLQQNIAHLQLPVVANETKSDKAERIVEAYTRERRAVVHAPRICIILDFLSEAFCFPIPGYLTVHQCGAFFLTGVYPPSDGDVFDLVAADNAAGVQAALHDRVAYLHGVFWAARNHLAACVRPLPLERFMPLPAATINLNASSIRDEMLRKLHFVRDLECATQLKEIQMDRLSQRSCTVLRVGAGNQHANEGNRYPAFFMRFTCEVVSPAATMLQEDKDAREAGVCKWVMFPYVEGTPVVSEEMLQFQDIAFIDKMDCKLAPKMWFAGLTRIECDPTTGAATAMEIQLENFVKGINYPKEGSLVVLAPRLSDYTTPKMMRYIRDLDVDRTDAADACKSILRADDFKRFCAVPPMPSALDKDTSFAKTVAAMIRLYKLLGTTLSAELPSIEKLQFRGSQPTVFRKMLQQRCLVVWGPPGTGKTHFLALSALILIAAAYKMSDGAGRFRVLVTAFTHPAIDNLLDRIMSLLDIASNTTGEEKGEWKTALSICKYESGNKRTHLNAPPPLEGTGGAGGAGEAKEGEAPVINERFHIAGATVWRVQDALLNKEKFDLIIVDEGSQLPVSEALIPLHCLASNGRFVVCGDHLQLGPILRNSYPTNAQIAPLHGSLLDLLLYQADHLVPVSGVTASLEELGNDDPFASPSWAMGKLRHNYRMNKELTAFTKRIYGMEYEQAKKLELLSIDLARWPTRIPSSAAAPDINLVYAALQENAQEGVAPLPALLSVVMTPVPATGATAPLLTHEMQVDAEARFVAELIFALHQSAEWLHRGPENIFVVAPHRAQRESINRHTNAKFNEELSGSPPFTFADTVERRQGTEADIVIVCYSYFDSLRVALEAEFVYNRSRFNVAVTRARQSCIFITTPAVLAEVGPSNDASGVAAVLGNVAGIPSRRDCLLHMRAFVAQSTSITVPVSM